LKCKAEFKDSVDNSDLVAMVVPSALVQVDPVADEEAEAVVKPQWSSMADPSPSQPPQSQPQRLQHLPQLKEAKVEPDKETKEVEADKTVKTTNKMTSKTPSAT
jgi:hypothetical protein